MQEENVIRGKTVGKVKTNNVLVLSSSREVKGC